ncbi:MAG: insulinase family protein [Acidobacteriia bacterium]|nr:insulinase family protein [Terriglobia bacterium]
MRGIPMRGICMGALISAAAWGQGQKAPAAGRGVDSLTMGVKIAEPGRIQTPAMESWKLGNGMRVLIGVNTGLPLISGTVLVRAGVLFDPADRIGLTEVAARVLQHGGSRKQDGAQMLRKLDEWGAKLAISADVSELRVTFSCLGRHLKPMLEMLAELMREPGFPVEALERAQVELRNGIAERNNNPMGVALRVFQEAMHGENASRRLSPGYAELEAIQIEDLRRFQEQYLRPDAGQLALTGDFEIAAVREMVENSFGRWEAGAGATPAPAQRKPDGQAVKGVLLARTPDSETAMLVAGHSGIRMADAGYIPSMVMAQVLNRRMEAAIERNARRAGWTASFSMAVETHPLMEGTIQIRGTVRTGSAAKAVEFVQNQVPELLASPVTEEEVENGKQRTRLLLEVRAEQEARLFEYCAWLRFHQMGGEGAAGDPFTQWQKDLAGLTKGAVEQAMKKHVRPGQFTVVVAGHAESFFPPLSGAREIDLSSTPAKAPGIRTNEESRRQGLVWLGKMRHGLGGEEKLASIKDYRVEYEGELPGRGAIKLRESWMEGTLRQDQDGAGGTVSIFYNGKIGWMGRGGLVAPLPSSMLEQVRGDLFRQPFRLALRGKEKAGTVDYLGSGSVELTGEHEQWARVQLDEETGLPKKTSYRLRTAAGALLQAEDVYSDWRNEGGVMWPGRILTRRGGSGYSELRMVRIEWNKGLTQTEMEKKP